MNSPRALRWRESVAGVALATPATVIVLVLFAYPFFLSFGRSLTVEGESPRLGNYEVVFARYGDDVVYTIAICAVSLALVLVLAGTIGGAARLLRLPVVEFLFTIPLFVPFVVIGHAMRVFLAPHGTLNSVLSILPFYDPEGLPSFVFGSAGLIAAFVWKHLGLAVLLVLAAFRGVSEEYLDAARNLGARSIRLVIQHLVPLAKGTFGVVAILTATSIFGNFSIPAMIGSGGGTMLMVNLYDAINLRRDYGVANAIGLVSYLLSLGAVLYYFRSLRKERAR